MEKLQTAQMQALKETIFSLTEEQFYFELRLIMAEKEKAIKESKISPATEEEIFLGDTEDILYFGL